MPSIDFDAIKREISLSEVLDLIGWKPIWSQSGQHRGPCPLHASNNVRSRSMSVNGDGWYCHKCKTGGDQLRLWAMVKGIELVPATIDLCKALNRPVYYQRRRIRGEEIGNGEEAR